jgi:hypothetical protein
MTDKYKEGHEPQWTEVEAGLDLNFPVAEVAKRVSAI